MRADVVPGSIKQGDEPDWTPLLAVVGQELASWFMWVFEVELSGGISVHAYKHVSTRSYLFMDGDRRAYEDDGAGGYIRRPLPVAITRAFAGWERAAPAEQDVAALRHAVCRARLGA